MTNTLESAQANDIMREYCYKKLTPALGLTYVEI